MNGNGNGIFKKDDPLLYKAKDFLRLVWVIVGIALIILITPMKAKDKELKNDINVNVKSINKNAECISDLKTADAVLSNTDVQLKDVLKNMQEDIKYLVRKSGGTPSSN